MATKGVHICCGQRTGRAAKQSLVQMCLARLLKFLKLDKACQTSFAEYHSKRNFVERAHAEENRVYLSMDVLKVN